MKEIYLVTGVTGFLGRTIAEMLIKEGKSVVGLRLPEDRQNLIPGVRYIIGDLTKPHTLLPFFETAIDHHAYLIHSAGMISIASKHQNLMYKVNVLGTKHLVSLALKFHIDRFVYVSSVHAIKEEAHGKAIKESSTFSAKFVNGTYAKTKAEATAYVLASVKRGLPAVVVHPSGIIGPNDPGNNYMSEVIHRFLRGYFPMAIEGGYDFVDVRDVATGVLQACRHGRIGETYIFSNHFLTIREMFNMLSRLRGKVKKYRVFPLKLIKPFGKMIEWFEQKLHLPLLITPYSLYALGSNGNFDHKKATAELNYHPRPLEETFRSILQFYKK